MASTNPDYNWMYMAQSIRFYPYGADDIPVNNWRMRLKDEGGLELVDYFGNVHKSTQDFIREYGVHFEKILKIYGNKEQGIYPTYFSRGVPILAIGVSGYTPTPRSTLPSTASSGLSQPRVQARPAPNLSSPGRARRRAK